MEKKYIVCKRGCDDDDGNGASPKPETPGFEAIAVFVALAIALIILRRRK